MPQIEYNIIRSKSLTSSTTITVSEKTGVTVRAPFWVPEFSIKKFVDEKSSWIWGQQKRINLKREQEKKYEDGEAHLFSGKEFLLQIIHSQTPIRTQINLVEDKMIVKIFIGHSDKNKKNEIKEAILRLYLEEGIGIITEKVNFYSEKLQVTYSRIDLKKVSSIWGSCSAGNNLSFNRKLVMAPHEIVDYVIIHETCHMIQRNHSSRFWSLVAKLDPYYREHRRWLRDNHHLLTI